MGGLAEKPLNELEVPAPNVLSMFFDHVKVDRKVSPDDNLFCALKTSESYRALPLFTKAPMVLY